LPYHPEHFIDPHLPGKSNGLHNGSDIIELNCCCPNMSFNVQLSEQSTAMEPFETGIKVVDRSVTTSDEQRSTPWMSFESLREALDPAHGSLICLPPDKEVIADLCAAKYKYTPSGVLIESKDEIKARIGRSPDVGEAIMMTMMGPVREYGGVSVDVPMSAYKTKRRSIWD